jgi:Nitrate and nitrite sensing/Histidine kinase-, DNA gyrase B-, and HSP90-like ATPase
MAQSPQTKRRPVGAAVLAIPLLAVLVLSGVGTALSLRDGARAEQVRGLVPFTTALTSLVHDLQRERRLSAARADAADQEPGDPGPVLEAARRAVDGTAAGYRDAAVRLDLSDRDRGLHERLDAGLTQLAGLTALRASVDNPAGAADSAAVFRGYTEIVGGLLAVDGEIGQREADRDAGLLRAVTAASAFSRASELADRERAAAAQAADRGRVEPADRTRLAALGGRQDALLDQFGALANPGQLLRYTQAVPAADAEQLARLRRAALDARHGPTADLPAWSRAATTRGDRMRQVEPALTAEVARLAALADQTADRRALVYGGVFLLTASAVAALLVLARRSRTHDAASGKGVSADPAPGGPAFARAAPGGEAHTSTTRAAGTPKPRLPLPSPPEGERSPAAIESGAAVHSPLGHGAQGHDAQGRGAPGHDALGRGGPGGPGPGLADLARRSQDLADQVLELLDRTGRDQADPRLPGRLLQIDRLAVRARRNAHNLIVLAGGEPGRQWSGPAPLAEVVAAAVSDNPDAPRIDLAVSDDLLIPGPVADDLANLLAELVDNATAFSAPETRVEVRGQKVGSGYVLEVEDRGLGMTDGELEAVNRRLAGDPAAGDDLDQRLGTWVVGRLAERHQVRVQLRRSSYGGVTALVFFPERLVAAPEPNPPVPGPPVGEATPGTGTAAPVVHSLPLRRYVTQVPEGDQPLPKRAPHTSLAPDLAAAGPGDPGRAGDPRHPPASGARPGTRSPEQVRSMLTRYRSGLERGRAAAARDLPDDPDDDPAA